MLEKSFALNFATEWIAAWNSHDLERILSHYTDDFEMSSPLIAQIAGEPSGRLKGKADIRAYWAKGLSLNPQLHFDLKATLLGANSLTLYYKGHRGMSAEVLVFGAENKVVESFAHYEL